jgi:hypothetical protein
MPRRFRPRPNRYTQYKRTERNFGKRGRGKKWRGGGSVEESSSRGKLETWENGCEKRRRQRTGRYYRRDRPRN